eukprot:gnl/Dysnectes_brevis/2470_a2953_2141.p1 GENE.gnl/Dysnectes_brevis/2470_a2953_2141~~gnl/Dysnectes_brevis/2470_a2953_2141.p1  ORF type:complete len:107 (+),score=4.84 gnl/Dysnectes_brevis/2470_a2953_2141:60-380(+)
MAQQGASLQSYNNELVKLIEDLKLRRSGVDKEIRAHQEEKAKIEQDLEILKDRLRRLDQALDLKVAARSEFDKTIQETEAAYMRILESSQKLVEILKSQTQSMSPR